MAAMDFLSQGGEMGTLTRERDWSATPLGPPETWPEALKTTLRLVLTSRHPMFIWWGPDLLQFYNDAYRQTMGRSGIQALWANPAGNAGKRYGTSLAPK